MSLIVFTEQFGTEEQCRAHLFTKRFGNGFICPEYGHTWYINQRIRVTMTAADDKYKLDGKVTVDEASFTGTRRKRHCT
jgi:hypothetical protein